MTKKFVSIFLALAMCLTLAAPAFAETPTKDEPEYDEIVVFSDTISGDGVQPLSALTNEERIQQAREGVLALNLGKMGFSYIEEACLSELKRFSEEDSIILQEYTVLIPKNRAATPRYLDTYKDVDIYFDEVSKGGYGRTYGKEYHRELVQWIAGTIDFLVSISGGSMFSLPWSVVSTLNGIPTLFDQFEEDEMTKSATFNFTTQAFYAKDGNTYKNVLNREYGTARCILQCIFIDTKVGGFTYNLPEQQVPEITKLNYETYKNYLIIAWGAYVNNYSAPLEFPIWTSVTLDWTTP